MQRENGKIVPQNSSEYSARSTYYLNNLTPGKTYRFSFHANGKVADGNPLYVNVHIGKSKYDGMEKETPIHCDGDGNYTVSFTVPADYTESDLASITFDLEKGEAPLPSSPSTRPSPQAPESPGSLALSGMTLSDDSPTPPVTPDIDKIANIIDSSQFPEIQKLMNGEIQKWLATVQVQNYVAHVPAYNQMLKDYDPTSKGASGLYAFLKSVYSEIVAEKQEIDGGEKAFFTQLQSDLMKAIQDDPAISAYFKSHPEYGYSNDILPQIVDKMTSNIDLDKNLPAVPAAPKQPGPPTPPPPSSGIGSGETDAKEMSEIQSNAKDLIAKAQSDYQALLTKYKSDGNWQALYDGREQILAKLAQDVQAAIQSASRSSDFGRIYNDYTDPKDLTPHIRDLLEKTPEISSVFSKNLLPDGSFDSPDSPWKITSGNGSIQVGKSKYPNSPVGDQNSGTLQADGPNGVSMGQTIKTEKGKWYLVYGYVDGVGQPGKAHDGSISVTGARVLNGKDLPQVSNEIDEGGLHRRYFWVQATGDSMTVHISGTTGTSFQGVGVREVSEGMDPATTQGNQDTYDWAQKVIPPVTTAGSPEAGWYPQIERKLNPDDNLLDGGVSIMKNIDPSALGNAGHPYWYFDPHDEKSKDIQIVNGLNGAHGISIPSGASPTTNGMVPIPSGDYTYSCDIDGGTAGGTVKINVSGTSLIDGEKLYGPEQTITLKPGMNHITFKVPSSTFPSNGTFFRPAISITNQEKGSAITLYNTSLKADSSDTIDKINAINPYNPDRSWYNLNGKTVDYDFTKGDISRDWGVALSGNTMFPASPKDVSLTDQGIQLDSHNGKDQGGIQSTQLIDPMKDFTFSTTFKALKNDPGYEPAFAVWFYGESQRGPDDPLTHRGGSGADPITEFDCEMGSDPNTGQPDPGKDGMYMRPSSYVGYEMGGHSEILPPHDNWIKMPNFWNSKDTYNLQMKGEWKDGHLWLTRTIKDLDTGVTTQLGDPQDLGSGPFSPMYAKIGLESPDWNAKSHGQGGASVALTTKTVDGVTYGTSLTQGPDIPENVDRGIPLSKMDYTWFIPGGGGGMAYTPFKSRAAYRAPDDPAMIHSAHLNQNRI